MTTRLDMGCMLQDMGCMLHAGMHKAIHTQTCIGNLAKGRKQNLLCAWKREIWTEIIYWADLAKLN